MSEFIVAFVPKLAWATLSLSIASLLLSRLAGYFNPKSHRLLAMSGYVPLLIGALFFGWTLAIPERYLVDLLHIPNFQFATKVESESHDQNFQLPNETESVAFARPYNTLPSDALPLEARDGTTSNKMKSSPWMLPTKRIFAWTIFTVWILGLTWRVAAAYQKYRKLSELRCVDFSVAPKAWQALWHRLLRSQNCADIPIYTSSSFGPALCLFPSGQALVLPRDTWAQTTESDRELVLRHELAHYKNDHILKVAVCRALALMHWFNPIARACVARFELACEWQADDEAIGRSENSALKLADSLLRFHAPRNAAEGIRGAVELASVDSQLKNRVVRLLSPHREKEASKMKVFSMIVTGILLVFLSTAKFTLEAREPAIASNLDSNGDDFNETTNEPMPIAKAAPSMNPSQREDESLDDSSKENPFRSLFDEIARKPRDVSKELFRQAMPTQRWENNIQFNSVKSIRRSEAQDHSVTYEFEADPMSLFTELTSLLIGDQRASEDILDGIQKDPKGPMVNLRQILQRDIQPKMSLRCRFNAKDSFEYLLEIGLVDEARFLPEFKKLMRSEPDLIQANSDSTIFVFSEIIPDASNLPPQGMMGRSWSAAVRDHRLFWGSVDLVKKAVEVRP